MLALVTLTADYLRSDPNRADDPEYIVRLISSLPAI